ncbi:hypothetical protein GH811_06190 [Acetobacterium malicum]|jgi:hypothetical protein|uniref:Uncharacterized protein n=1 Tax=Acetobacterium malicum TaxID=52692 RepID=A0ABR6YVL5_9FIRM|nr:hypothetical protein [Acetobacterium malicum]MBC3899204.1 hypothetical protein [Acetobacterium malicum]
MNDVEMKDLIGNLKDDIQKAMLLGGDITCDYLGMCGDPRELPEPEKTKFMRDLLWQYHRYSITMELLMDLVLCQDLVQIKQLKKDSLFFSMVPLASVCSLPV